MRPDVRRWFDRRTTTAEDWPLDVVRSAKRCDTTVSVVLPALNEEATVGAVVATIVDELVPLGLVDEVVVMDSGSTDGTAEVAEAAGATVHHRDDVLPEHGSRPGKGEVLWKSLAVTSGDVLVFVDADLQDFSATLVTALLGPVLTDPGVDFVKACYDRPLAAGSAVLPAGGGRVTELVARPLLNLYWPALAGVVQPLSGEYAGRRDVLQRIPFAGGYGVELGMLIDLVGLVGLDRLAQVDLGRRVHRHQDDAALGRMASVIWQTALTRLEREGRIDVHDAASTALTQFVRDRDGYAAVASDVSVDERPPMIGVASYARRRAARAS